MSRRVYSNDMKLQIVQMHEKGISQKVISDQLNLNKSVVSRIIKRWKIRGSVMTMPRSGRPRMTTTQTDRQISRCAKKDPFISATHIKADLQLAISSRTIQRRLVEQQLYSRRPATKPLLTKKQRLARLKFAREHIDWDLRKWSTVLFSDESKFNLVDSDGICHVRRPVGKRLDPRYYRLAVKHGGGSVFVWGCFSAHGMGPLHKINGIMDRFQYLHILNNVMFPFATEEMPLRWIFQHDNDPKHTAKLVKSWLEDNHVIVLPWPSNSPDLNPIENLWEIVNRKVRDHRTYSNITELYNALCNEWRKIPIEVIQNLIHSMPRRCAEIIKNHGYAIDY